LFVVLLVAGFLGGIKAGFQRGYSAGQAQRAKETPVARVYPVASLVLPTPDAPPSDADFHTLIDLITSSIEPESWDSVGGPGSIAAFPPSLSLVVTQTPGVHERIAVLVKNMEDRRGATNAASGHAVPAQD
jgi:general secretion pathway protein D